MLSRRHIDLDSRFGYTRIIVVAKDGIEPTNPYRKAGLPTRRGRFRFIPVPGADPQNPPKGLQHGFIDKFSNEWAKGPPHHFLGDDFEWDVQSGGNHINVSKYGCVA